MSSMRTTGKHKDGDKSANKNFPTSQLAVQEGIDPRKEGDMSIGHERVGGPYLYKSRKRWSCRGKSKGEWGYSERERRQCVNRYIEL